MKIANAVFLLATLSGAAAQYEVSLFDVTTVVCSPVGRRCRAWRRVVCRRTVLSAMLDHAAAIVH